MKKCRMIVTIVILILLVGCEKELSTTTKLIVNNQISTTTTTTTTTKNSEQFTEEEIVTMVQNLLDASYIESSFSTHIKTDELNMEVNPAIKIKKLVDKGALTSISYNSSLLKAFKISPFELILDERENLIYVYNENEWIKIDYDSAKGYAPNFYYINFDKLIGEMVTNSNGLQYLGTEKLENKTLSHYTVEVNLYVLLNEIYTTVYENSNLEISRSFDSFLNRYKLSDFINILNNFVLDIYVDDINQQIVQIEADGIQFLDFLVMYDTSFVDNYLPEDLDLQQLRIYLQDLEFVIHYERINEKTEIKISQEALNAPTTTLRAFIEHIMKIQLENSEPIQNDLPSIVLKGEKEMTVYLGNTFDDPGVVAYDFEDNNITSRIQTIGSVDDERVGTYVITYSVIDSFGHKVWCDRTVNVEFDPNRDYIYPTITLNGPSEVQLLMGEDYVEAFVTANDNIDGDISNLVTIENKVNMNREGNYSVTYTVKDSSGNTSTVERKVIVRLDSTEAKETNIFDFHITDSLINPNGKVIYLTDSFNKRVIEYNLETYEIINSINFDLIPEKMAFYDDKLYVTLLTKLHNYYNNSNQEGSYAVINTNDFKDISIYDVALDSYDITADKDGYVYLTDASGDNVKVYDSNGEEVASKSVVNGKNNLIYNEVLNRIYLIPNYDINLSNIQISSYTFDAPSKTITGFTQQDEGYRLLDGIFISPEGRYIFNSEGPIFTCNHLQSEDMAYVTTLTDWYGDIAFNLEDNEFYLLKGNNIYTYDYSSFSYKSMMQIDDNDHGQCIYFANDKIYIVGYEDLLWKNFIKTYDLPN